MVKRLRNPALPTLPNDTPRSLRPLLESIREVVQTRFDSRAGLLHNAVTFADLQDIGAIRINPRLPDGYESVLNPRPGDVLRPTNVQAFASFSAVQITWDQANYANHSHTAVYRTAYTWHGPVVEGDPLPTLTFDAAGQPILAPPYDAGWPVVFSSSLVQVGATSDNRFIDLDVQANALYVYFVRHVGDGGVDGPLNSTTGTVFALVPLTPSALLEDAVDQLLASRLPADLIARIELLDQDLLDELAGYSNALAALEVAIADVDTELAAADARLTADLAGLDARVVAADNALGSRISAEESATAEAASKFDSLGTWNGTNFSVVANLETTTSIHAARLASLGTWSGTDYSRISALETTNASQATSISNLTTRVGTAESSITSLNSTTSGQATSINNLTTRMGSAESSITSLNSTTSGQATSISNLTTRMGSAESSITSLNTTTSTHATRLASLGTWDGANYSRISSLETTNSSQATSINNLTTRMGSAESSITSLNTTTANQATQINQVFTKATGASYALAVPAWTGSQSVPQSTAYAGAWKTNFTIPAALNNRPGVLRVLINDAEQSVRVAYRGVDLGVCVGADNADVWYEFPITVVTGANEVAVWATTADGAAVKRIEVRAGELVDGIAAIETKSNTAYDLTAGASAQYTIKVQAGAGGANVIAGIGLMASTGSGSEVIIAADKFAVVNPNFASDAQAYKPFVYDSTLNRVVVESAAIVNLTAEQFVGGKIIADSLAVNQYVALPAGSISTDMLDPSFLSSLVRRNNSAVESGGTWNVPFSVVNGTVSKAGVIRGASDDLAMRIFVSPWTGATGFYTSGAHMSSARRLVRFTVQRGGVTITNAYTGQPAVFTAYTRFVDQSGAVVTTVSPNGYGSPGAYLTEKLPSLEFMCRDATGDGGTHTYSLVVEVRNAADTANSTLASPPSGTFSGDEPISAVGGVYVSTGWADITDKPSTATRWPQWNEISGSTLQTLPGGGSVGTHGSVSISGDKGGFCGVHFPSTDHRLMFRLVNSNPRFGIHDGSAWKVSWDDNGALNAGTVGWSKLTAVPETASRWPTYAEVTSKPTTVAGFGITDAVKKSAASATFTTTAGTWYRIAQSAVDINRNSGLFRLDWFVGGNHGSVRFTAANHYGQAASAGINQIEYATYGTGGIVKARVVYHTTYTGNRAYVEVQFAAALTNVYVNVEVADPLGWSLLTPSTEGSIPAGYSNYERTFVPVANITAGTYRSVTINQEGRVTGGTNPTTLAGYGITDAAALTGAAFTGSVSSPYINATTAVQFNGKAAIGGTNDPWLRLNPTSDFTNGIYCGTSVLRTDGSLQVGGAGASFLADGNGAFTSGRMRANGGSSSSWGTNGNGAFSHVRANDSQAHWLITSTVADGDIRAGIQVLNSDLGAMRLYTNKRTAYVQALDGGLTLSGSQLNGVGGVNIQANGTLVFEARNSDKLPWARSHATGNMSKVMTWDDFTPALGPPKGLENVITTNWLAAGAVTATIIGAGQINATHVQAGISITAPILRGGRAEFVGANAMKVSSATAFGPDNLIYWFGPKAGLVDASGNPDLALLTKANATNWEDGNGGAYFGGQLNAGTLDVAQANWGTKVGIYKTGVDVLGTAWNPVLYISNLAAGETGLIIKAGARQAGYIVTDAGSYGPAFRIYTSGSGAGLQVDTAYSSGRAITASAATSDATIVASNSGSGVGISTDRMRATESLQVGTVVLNAGRISALTNGVFSDAEATRPLTWQPVVDYGTGESSGSTYTYAVPTGKWEYMAVIRLGSNSYIYTYNLVVDPGFTQTIFYGQASATSIRYDKSTGQFICQNSSDRFKAIYRRYLG